MKNKIHIETYKGKSNKKKIIILIMVALFLIAAILFGVTKLLSINEKPFVEPAKPQNNKKNTATKQEKKPKDPGAFELPIEGSTGFASVSMPLKSENSNDSNTKTTLKAGDGFCIIKEDGDLWKVETEKDTGWVSHKYCMINLPDIIPSVIYNNTNSISSVFMSSGKEIPGITGEKLYDAIKMNKRFHENLPLMPVIYSMSPKIYEAQQAALENNESLLLIESYRPSETQRKVVDKLSNLMASDSEVRNGINKSPWSQSWFISTGKSNHQRGIAIDVTLAEVKKIKEVKVGDYVYKKVTDYNEYEMPSAIHELSTLAVSFKKPFDSLTSQWKNVSPSDQMNEEALRLQKYCTDTGLTPLASEWWHFDDPESNNNVSGNKSDGNYYLTDCFSRI